MNLKQKESNEWFIFNEDDLVKVYDTENIDRKHYNCPVNGKTNWKVKYDTGRGSTPITSIRESFLLITTSKEFSSINDIVLHEYDNKNEKTFNNNQTNRFKDNFMPKWNQNQKNKDSFQFQNINNSFEMEDFLVNQNLEGYNSKKTDFSSFRDTYSSQHDVNTNVDDISENGYYRLKNSMLDPKQQINDLKKKMFSQINHISFENIDSKIAQCLCFLDMNDDGVYTFICQKCCYKTNGTPLDFKRHVKEYHEHCKIKYSCAKCLLEQKTSENMDISRMKRHISTVHEKKKQNKCSLCPFKTADKGNLKAHIKRMHLLKERSYKCTYCSYMAKDNYTLQSHIKSVHLKEKNYKCNVCSYRARKNSDLQRHIKTVHLKKKNFKCTLCSYITGRGDCLREHVICRHKNIEKHKCHLCSYKAVKKSNLKKHITVVHMQKKQFERTSRNKNQNSKVNDKIHKCHLCPYKAVYKGYLKTHITVVHMQEKNYNCKFCPYKTGWVHYLKIHEESIHMNKKPYQCIHCAYRTEQQSTLRSHIKIKHNNKTTKHGQKKRSSIATMVNCNL